MGIAEAVVQRPLNRYADGYSAVALLTQSTAPLVFPTLCMTRDTDDTVIVAEMQTTDTASQWQHPFGRNASLRQPELH
jgi:hypothetical protein